MVQNPTNWIAKECEKSPLCIMCIIVCIIVFIIVCIVCIIVCIILEVGTFCNPCDLLLLKSYSNAVG